MILAPRVAGRSFDLAAGKIPAMPPGGSSSVDARDVAGDDLAS
ncbi:MAG: hypothetical protein U0165_05920 [Polyangiaceae bacterium]